MSWKAAIENAYAYACKQKSDINEHIPFLYNLGSECSHITEMGTRRGMSTRAFLATDATLRAYDLYLDERMVQLFASAKEAGKDVEYIKADVLKTKIDETDLLFIDTWHTGTQLRKELKLHSKKVRKYLVFHDTITYGLKDEAMSNSYEVKPGDGLLPAIINFMIRNPEWRFKEFRVNNNGLTVLERV